MSQVVSGLPELKAEVVIQVRDRLQELAAQPGVGAQSGPGIDIAGQIQDAISGIEIQRPT